jgi:hypothetical protein
MALEQARKVAYRRRVHILSHAVVVERLRYVSPAGDGHLVRIGDEYICVGARRFDDVVFAELAVCVRGIPVRHLAIFLGGGIFLAGAVFGSLGQGASRCFFFRLRRLRVVQYLPGVARKCASWAGYSGDWGCWWWSAVGLSVAADGAYLPRIVWFAPHRVPVISYRQGRRSHGRRDKSCAEKHAPNLLVLVDAARLKGTSRYCASRLAGGNAQGQTHSETSSNYLCTNVTADSGETSEPARVAVMQTAENVPKAV